MSTVTAFDVETTGFNAYKGDVIFAFVLTDEETDSKVYRFDNTSNHKNEVSKKVFRDFILEPNIAKVAHNAKFEMGFVSQWFGGELPAGDWHDTFIMSKMLRNLMISHKQETLSERYFHSIIPEDVERWSHYDKEVKKHMTMQKRLINNYGHRFQDEVLEPLMMDGIAPLVIDRPNYGLIPLEIMNGYQQADGERCMLLHQLQYPKIVKDKEMYQDYLNEIKLLRTSQRMEQRGMMLHRNETDDLIEFLKEEVNNINIKKRKIFGFDINLASGDQLQKHFFGYVDEKKHENLNEDWKKVKPVFDFTVVKYTPKDKPSTDKEALGLLEKLYPDEPVIDMLLKSRSYSKGIAMIEGYKEIAGENLIIHPGINTNQAKTGRQSVSNPALQCVQKEVSLKSKYGIPARRCFRPRPGYVYFLGDYAGIEMRLIIAASGEKVLIEKLNDDIDFDAHAYNGWAMFRDEYEVIMRPRIKDAGFGVCYGAKIASFALAIDRPIREARRILSNFEEICPKLCSFTQDKIKEVGKLGYITTAFGRKLYVEREKAFTAANYQIQGDAAGILKRAQNNTDDYLKEVWSDDIRMLLTVHDEMILEYPRHLLEKKEEILHDISYLMTNMPEISVPLVTEWKMTTSTWADAKEITI